MFISDLGRGPRATTDMKARIAHLRASGQDVFAALWERHHHAIKLHEGYSYDFAPAELVRPDGQRGQPGDG